MRGQSGARALLDHIKSNTQFSDLPVRWLAIRRRTSDFHFEVEHSGLEIKVEINTRVFEDEELDGVEIVESALKEANRMARGLTHATKVRGMTRGRYRG